MKTGLAIACAPAIKSPPYGLSPRNVVTFRPAAAQRSRRKRGALVGVAACALCARQIGLVVGAGIELSPPTSLALNFQLRADRAKFLQIAELKRYHSRYGA